MLKARYRGSGTGPSGGGRGRRGAGAGRGGSRSLWGFDERPRARSAHASHLCPSTGRPTGRGRCRGPDTAGTGGSAAPAAAEGIVGGFPVDVSQAPWTVALSSRDRFGGTRSGQFCGGVVVGPTTVLTAAHCLEEDVLGSPPHQVPDLKVIAGRTDLRSDQGQEVAVRESRVNPGYDDVSNSGDFAVLDARRAVAVQRRRRDGRRGRPGVTRSVPGPRSTAGAMPRAWVATRTGCGCECAGAARRAVRAGVSARWRRQLRRRGHGVRGAGAAGRPRRVPGGQRGAARWPRGASSGWCPG
ncbi:hypothetical protein SGLAM104S_01014 [Streptomyces glaucescens]